LKKEFIVSIFLVLTMVLSGCSSAVDSSAPDNSASDASSNSIQGGSTVTVKDMKGSVDIPANPQRIVDVAGLSDELIILGVPFIASANTNMFDGVTVPAYLQDYFTENKVEIVGNYSGAAGDLNLEKIAELKPDLIIMNIRHDKVYDQLKAIAPTLMIDDDINFVNWRGRFQQLGEWFGKQEKADEWLKAYDARAAELSKQVKDVVGDETFAVLEANSVHFGSYYVYRTGGQVVDAEYFATIDADHVFFFSDDGKVGDTANTPTWQNLKAVKNGNVYLGENSLQYDMAYSANGKLLYMEKLANAIINHGNVE